MLKGRIKNKFLKVFFLSPLSMCRAARGYRGHVRWERCVRPCERFAYFLKAAQAPTGIAGGVAALGAKQVKGRRAI